MDNNELKDLIEKSAAALESELTKTAELEAKLAEAETKNAGMQEKLASYERKDRCEKIVNNMIDKGLISHSDFQVEVRKLASSKDDLDVVEKAAEMLENKTAGLAFVENDGGSSNTHMTPEEKFAHGMCGSN